ncbi:MAG: nucleotidyltransferase domain-containing protein [Candidatus Bathyarchaeia archaeon]
MWVPKWLGEYYSKLYVKFRSDLFTFNDARRLLSIDENRLSVAFSKLHSKRFILVFNRSRPRLYRLLDPENIVFLASGIVKNFNEIHQERYLKLVLDCLRASLKIFDLDSFAIYGSVARGVASNMSDIDILLVSDSFSGSIASRMADMCKIEDLVTEELRWLRKNGIYTTLSLYPLRRKEAERMPILFLDLTEDAVIFYDKDGFLENLLLDFKSKLTKAGAKRIFVNGKRWYWDLNPDYRRGETVGII